MVFKQIGYEKLDLLWEGINLRNLFDNYAL